MTAAASDDDNDLLDELEGEARRKLIQGMRNGDKALAAIEMHEKICAMRWRLVWRLMTVSIVLQVLILLGVPAPKIAETLLHVVGG